MADPGRPGPLPAPLPARSHSHSHPELIPLAAVPLPGDAPAAGGAPGPLGSPGAPPPASGAAAPAARLLTKAAGFERWLQPVRTRAQLSRELSRCAAPEENPEPYPDGQSQIQRGGFCGRTSRTPAVNSHLY
ncbi:translation initiation factor IF-2-like [Onychostruthus taczanowskii]|uniref:translation initiation factor IF-2-like n=1 Tax=Onychostruthus taczanowskii TaxID=356909 RepID=UPI001B8039AA|nr:translation initiation factor IF-2-like [Onychostruthus taczanowskii]